MEIQEGRPEHYPAVCAIHAHHVVHGYATFDERPSTVEERLPWFAQFTSRGLHQLRLAINDGQVLGYAASLPYRSHPAFDRTVELSVYLDPASTGRGLGKALYLDLIERVRAAGALSAVAGVALPNPASVALHRSFGFREVGTFVGYAEKGGHRISSSWFQLQL